MDRAAFGGGPAYLTFDGVTYQMSEDWDIKDDPKSFPIESNLQGELGQGIEDTMAVISFSPLAFSGSLSTLLAKMFPYQPSMIGQRIFPSTDLPVVIQTKEGKSITFSAGALTKMPSATFSPTKKLLGNAEITCLVKNSTAQTDAAAFVAVAASAYTEPSILPLTLVYDLYTTAFGATFTDIETMDGVTFEPVVTLESRVCDSRGTYNMQIKNVTASVKFTPESITEANWYDTIMRHDGTGVQRGKQRANFGEAFTVTAATTGNPRLTIPLAYANAGGVKFDGKGRIAGITLQAARKSTAGTLSALYTLDVVP